MQTLQPLRVIRLREVLDRTGRSRSAVLRDVKAGTFPKPVRLSPSSVGWVESEVAAWLQARIDASRGVTGIAA